MPQRLRNSFIRSDGTLRNPASRARKRFRPCRPWVAVLSTAGCGYCLWLLSSLKALSTQDSVEGVSPPLSSAIVRDFQGVSRTVDNQDDKLRIAIVSNAVAFPYGEATTAQWSLFKEYFANKDCYAKTHGYDLIIDSRNHVDGMGFYTNGDGDRGGTNVHFNKPYLIRKWLPHYDWVLWLDMDTLVVDMARPIEKFIEEIGGQDGNIHVLVPQDQNVQFFFSACSLLLRNSPETLEMVEDWFTLKDTCPYALYDDQSRLYAAVLRMQLRWRGQEVDHSSFETTDCLDVCEKKETQGNFSWCVDAAIRAMGIRRVPELFPPVAYSRLPTRMFTKGQDTGLSFQGQFGGIKTHPHLVEYAFSVHTKPFCQKSLQICSPFVDAILAPNYQKGMQRCYGQGWVAKPYMALASLHDRAKAGPQAEVEALAVHVQNTSSVEALVPGLNVPFGLPFRGMRQGRQIAGSGQARGPGWREMGIKKDKKFCFASLPGAGGKAFMGQALAPVLKQRFCALSGCDGINVAKAKRRADRERIPCRIARVHQVFPYNLMADYPGNSRQPSWHMTMIRDPVDRTLATFLSLKARLAEEASVESEDGPGVAWNGWSRTLNSWCGETTYVQYGGNPPPTFGVDMTIDEYVEIPGVDDIMTKFYFNRDWDSIWHGGVCAGAARPLLYRPGGWEEFHHWQANAAVGALMEYQFFGVWELWQASSQLLRTTLGAELVDSADLDPAPETAMEMLAAGPNGDIEEEVRRLAQDPGVRSVIEHANKKDVMLYSRAVMEFKRRCRYLGVPVRDDPYLLAD
ncbi:unnamed protein product [Scytosiphon promiscuus]